ncbi:ABC transporter ATP-binding protein [Microbacterium sp. NPDC090007]|uniref:ABC transporter ATP-binding protein n=1 Tax=Microbacterium sp. NPDC090007 TaxID=3364204 RepID=UPI003812E86A
MLEARGLTFGYVRGAALLDGWSAAFETGSLTALTGPSGRGKSTLLYLLGLMLTPRAGDILVHGRSTRRATDQERARLRAEQFGFVFQDAALDATRSVLDNITEASLYRGTSRRAAAHRARELMDEFGVNVTPERRPGQVSGGQAQRISLCRALLGNPAVILADEPTGNLDPASSDVVVAALRAQARRGCTVVVVTHSSAVADECDEVVQL